MRTEMTGRNVYEVSKVASVFAAIELMATSRGRCISRLCDAFTGKSLWQHVLLIAKGAHSRSLRDGGSTFSPLSPERQTLEMNRLKNRWLFYWN